MTKQEIAEVKSFIRENRQCKRVSDACENCARMITVTIENATTDDELDRLLDDYERRQACYEKN